MCDKWKSDYVKNITCKGMVYDSGDGEYIVKGHIDSLGDSKILYWAANPPTYTTSYTGSGLPYANPDMAYDNTPNRGLVKAVGGKFEFRLRYPNSYYIGLGTVNVEPCCHIKVCGANIDKIHTIKLGNGIPFRMLTYPPLNSQGQARSSPEFYNVPDLPIRSQEAILRDSGYPKSNNMPNNFWGLKPPYP